MHELTAMIRADLKPALGVTEPGAVAFCAALAKSHLPGDLIHLDVRMNSGMSSRIYICATLKTTEGEAEVVVRDSHTNVTFIEVNGIILLEKPEEEEAASAFPLIHRYSFRELLDYIQTVPYPEIDFVLEAHRMNLELFREGLSSPRTVFARRLLAMTGTEETIVEIQAEKTL